MKAMNIKYGVCYVVYCRDNRVLLKLIPTSKKRGDCNYRGVKLSKLNDINGYVDYMPVFPAESCQ